MFMFLSVSVCARLYCAFAFLHVNLCVCVFFAGVCVCIYVGVRLASGYVRH